MLLLNVHQQWLGLAVGGLTLRGGQLVHHAQRRVCAAHERHQAGKVHDALSPAHQRGQGAHGNRHQDLSQEVLATQQGDVHTHPTPGALLGRAAKLGALVVLAEQRVRQRA